MHQASTVTESNLRRRLTADPNNWQLACMLGELVRLRGNFVAAEPLARNDLPPLNETT